MSKFNEFVEDLRNAVVVEDEAAFSKYVDLCRKGVEFAIENGYTKTKRPAESGYECHRVLTGALGGKYVAGNESYLSQGEHLEAHYWLYIAVPSQQKFSAPIWRMCNGKLPTTIADLELAKEIYRVGREAHSESLREMHADPEFKAALSARSKAMNADPEFKAAQAARSKARMKAMHADPVYAAANSARRTAMNADPEYKAANIARMKAMHADPEFRAANIARMTARNADPVFAAAHSARAKAQQGDRPWENTILKSRPDLLSIWAMLDQVYDYVTETGHGAVRCANHFGYPPSKTWKNMVKYVRKNGDPRLDSEFLEFQSNQPIVVPS